MSKTKVKFDVKMNFGSYSLKSMAGHPSDQIKGPSVEDLKAYIMSDHYPKQFWLDTL